ncbi:nucleotidyltransferase domain-containing protein [bacterium]|nr:nucleotidyltransferase domain-containing protein [bacterium]
MIDLIRDNLDRIRELCEQHHVQRLEVFGSAADGRFREGESDVDFVVEFENVAPLVRGEAYLGLLFALEGLLGLKVDLVSARPPGEGNPYFWRSVERHREVIYDRAGERLPVATWQ